MRKKITAIILCVMLILSLFPVTSLADDVSSSQGVIQSNGELVVYMLTGNSWEKVGSLSYDRFLGKKVLNIVNLSNDEVRIRIVQNKGGNAHLDAVLLGGQASIQAEGDSLVKKKLSKQDFDVITLEKKGIELTFPKMEGNQTLEIFARIEATVISQTPFLFPIQRGEWVINENSSFYQYEFDTNKETLKAGEILNALSDEEPLFKQVCLPGSGHPQGITYAWMANDNENIYVALDVTSDNTMDGDKDYAKVYVKTADGVKMFKVSVPDTKWGEAAFIYTNKADYQHKVYEFTIPLVELGIADYYKVQDIPVAFEVYGTLSDPIYFEPEYGEKDYIYNESEGTIAIKVFRPAGDYENVGSATISYGVVDFEGAATKQVDYTIEENGTMTFNPRIGDVPGDTEKSFNIGIIDDLEYEATVEKIKLYLTVNGRSDYYRSEIELSIIDNDSPTVQFQQASYETQERDGISIYVTRNGNGYASSVNYTITDIDTTHGVDYNYEKTGTITFKAGEAETDLWIAITNDSQDESDETFKITLSDPTDGFALGTPSETIVKIVDNDDEPQEPEEAIIQFDRTAYSVNENESKIVIAVEYTPGEEPRYRLRTLEGPETPSISVHYYTSDGTAVKGSDYTEVSGTLAFNEEGLHQIFEIPIINDALVEGNETVTLTLSDATGAVLGERGTATLTIVDDDQAVVVEPPREVPPSTMNLPKGTIIGRMDGYVYLGGPKKIMDGSKDIELFYFSMLSQNNPDNRPRVYYWNAEKMNWVALASYPAGEGKVKAINDNGYKGWFAVFGVIEPEFSDLQGSISEQLFNRMNGLGILEGIPIKGQTTLRAGKPEQTITRAEFAMLISRILNIDVDDHKLPLLTEAEAKIFIYANYEDFSKIAEWIRIPVGTMVRADLIAGEGREFRAEAPITRIEAAVMVSKALRLLKECKMADFSNFTDGDQLPAWAKQQVVEGVMNLNADDELKPNENISRTDAFEMLYKIFIVGLGW